MLDTVEDVLKELDAIREAIYSGDVPTHTVDILQRYEAMLRALPIKK